MNAEAPRRAYELEARTAETFGRMLWRARHHYAVSDGAASLGCPGEAILPGELFLAGIATCAIQLVEVFAQEEGLPLQGAKVAVWGDIDPANQPRQDVTLFTTVELVGAAQEQAEHLVERFKGRWPLYGSVAVATPDIRIEIRTRG